MIVILLTLSLFASVTADTVSEKGTPVYEGNKDHQVAILEVDYQQISVNFSKTFPSAKQQLWLKEGSHLFVYFLSEGNKVSAVFTVKGKMNYAVSVIGMADVPENILAHIKNDYPLFSFLHANKIQAGGYTAYELMLENCCEFITISSTDDEEIVLTKKMLKTTSDKSCGCKTF